MKRNSPGGDNHQLQHHKWLSPGGSSMHGSQATSQDLDPLSSYRALFGDHGASDSLTWGEAAWFDASLYCSKNVREGHKTEILKQCDGWTSANAQLPCKCWLRWGHWSQLEPSVSGMGWPQPLLAGKRLPTTKTLPPKPRTNRNHYLPAISFPHSKYNLIFMQLNGIVQHLQLPQS